MNPLHSLQQLYSCNHNTQSKAEINCCNSLKSYLKYLKYLGVDYIDEPKLINHYFKDISDSSNLRAYLLQKRFFNSDKTTNISNHLDPDKSEETFDTLEFNEFEEFCDGLDFNESEEVDNVKCESNSLIQGFPISEPSNNMDEFYFDELGFHKSKEYNLVKSVELVQLLSQPLNFSEPSEVIEEYSDSSIINLKTVLEGWHRKPLDYQSIKFDKTKKYTYQAYKSKDKYKDQLCSLIKNDSQINLNELLFKFNDIIEKMANEGLIIDSQFYMPLIKKCAMQKNEQVVLDLFNDMQTFGVELDIECYGSLIQLYAKLRNFEKAIEILKNIKNQGLTPNLFICNCLISAYVKENKRECAYEVFIFMQEIGIKPNVMTYARLIHLHALANEEDVAYDLFNQMKKDRIDPVKHIYNSLITVLVNQKSTNRAYEILKEMSEDYCFTTQTTYNALKSLFERENNVAGSILVESEIKKLKIHNKETQNHSSTRASWRSKI